ncbi:thermonuclease family protein [Humitalea sp. 24SJ18S-53]|uniref:thermonuclease family protein n=1 Tax=Humitalea sp. 24SJ18S-53 TaxID=3422307 RepID=UPI003D674ABD
MQRRGARLTLLLPILLAAGYLAMEYWAPAQPSRGARPSSVIAGAARVIDGDTIEIDRQRFRLHGIDAPEMSQTCQRSGAAYRCGEDAATQLRSLLGSRITQCTTHARDAYGRHLAVCRSAGQDVGEMMVRNGWAIAFRRYSSDYVSAENDARSRRAGLWAGAFDPPSDWRRQRP